MIDYKGVADPAGGEAVLGENDFLFSIERTGDGIKLVGMNGTAWKELSFSCDGECEQWIDEYGMTDK
jgi:hypothetical protein